MRGGRERFVASRASVARALWPFAALGASLSRLPSLPGIACVAARTRAPLSWWAGGGACHDTNHHLPTRVFFLSLCSHLDAHSDGAGGRQAGGLAAGAQGRGGTREGRLGGGQAGGGDGGAGSLGREEKWAGQRDGGVERVAVPSVAPRGSGPRSRPSTTHCGGVVREGESGAEEGGGEAAAVVGPSPWLSTKNEHESVAPPRRSPHQKTRTTRAERQVTAAATGADVRAIVAIAEEKGGGDGEENKRNEDERCAPSVGAALPSQACL